MVRGQIFLKGKEKGAGGGGWAETIPTSFFQCWSLLHLEIILPFAKLCYAFEKKKLFFYHHNFMKKVILNCLKMNLKISHKLR